MTSLIHCDVRVYVHVFYFFFFKQKTAYEMRISDWSSDVCSSDLDRTGRPDQKRPVFGRISEKEPLGARSCAADRRPDPDREHRDSELYRRPCPPKAVASGYRPGEGKGARMARAAIQHGPCRLPPDFPSEPAGRERPAQQDVAATGLIALRNVL